MTKTKMIKDEGGVINVDDSKLDDEPVQVSYTQAKKLVKREMSEKQKANVEKLVAINRKKWEEKRKQKEEEIKKQNEETKTAIIVKPKRIYKNRNKKDGSGSAPAAASSSRSYKEAYDKIDYDTDEYKNYDGLTESDESDDETIQLRKVSKKIDKKKKLLRKIDDVIKEVKKPSYQTALDRIWS